MSIANHSTRLALGVSTTMWKWLGIKQKACTCQPVFAHASSNVTRNIRRSSSPKKIRFCPGSTTAGSWPSRGRAATTPPTGR